MHLNKDNTIPVQRGYEPTTLHWKLKMAKGNCRCNHTFIFEEMNNLRTRSMFYSYFTFIYRKLFSVNMKVCAGVEKIKAAILLY